MKKVLTSIALGCTFLFSFGAANVNSEAVEIEQSKEIIDTDSRAKVTNGDYVLVTSPSELVLGRKVVIASSNYNYAMSSRQSSYNRKEVYVTKKTSDGKKVIRPTSSVGTFTLTRGYLSDTYAFYDSRYNGYLSATSNYYNYLQTVTSVGQYSSFSIDVNSRGVASIKANYFNKNKIRYNYYSGLFTCYSSGQYDVALYQEYVADTTPTPAPEQEEDTTVSVTGVSLNNSSLSLEVGNTKTLTATVTPSNATNKNVTWVSSNSSVASVTNGKVTALKAGTTTITVSTVDGSFKASCKVTVTEPTAIIPEDPVEETTTGKAAWTIMIYCCGADLESRSGLATSDIKEILSVKNQPEDVNIIIQTGGARSWNRTYGINASYTQRYHVKNNKLVLDENLAKANMGSASTFQSFIEWGLNSYPAEKTGVIMWNHGGAMQGICFDENYSDDSLLNSEVNQALTKAFSSTRRNDKLEFIGYDACLMSVQDIADVNSNFFNYMIASEETESGYGWDYDTWVDDLYRKSSTTTIMKAIVDGFIADNGGVNSSSNDQTLAYLNLSKMEAYKNAWENLASALSSKITSKNKSSFNTLVKSVKHYGDTYYTYYGIFDAKDFVNKLASNSTFNPGSTYTNAVLSAHSNLVEYSSCGRGAGNSNGLAMFWSVSSYCEKNTYYTASQTNFTNWRSLVALFGA